MISATFDRLGRAFRRQFADFFELSDAAALEDADRAARTAAALRARLGAGLAARERLNREQDAGEAEGGMLATKAEAAIGLGAEDLAAAAMRRKADLEARRAEIALELSLIETETAALEARLESLGGAAHSPALAAALQELDALIAANAGKEPKR